METHTADCLILLHIMKTGGTTLSRMLEHNVAPEHYHFLRDAQSVEEVLTIPEETRRSLKLLRAGHIPFGAHQYLPQSSKYVTMLRNPVDRVLSLYYFIYFPPNKEAPQPPVPLLEWAKSFSVIDNNQTHKLAGVRYKDREGDASRALLEAAKHNLDEHFSVVGLTERFDESVLLMRHATGLTNILYQNKNVNQNRPKKTADPAVVEIIKERNQLDTELYQYAQQRFDDQIAQIPSFSEELALFQDLNAQFTAAAAVTDEKVEVLKELRQRIQSMRESRDEFKLKFSHVQRAYHSLADVQPSHELSKLTQLKHQLKSLQFWKKS